jgi:REP element-mobilizing transposase RayT
MKNRSTLWGFVFISGSVYRRIPIFRYKMACKTFLCALEAYRRKYGFTVHAYALMPNHYHLLLWFPPSEDLTDFLRDFKSLVGKQILNWLRCENLTHLSVTSTLATVFCSMAVTLGNLRVARSYSRKYATFTSIQFASAWLLCPRRIRSLRLEPIQAMVSAWLRSTS